MSDELIRLTARQVKQRLDAGEISPLDLIDAAAARIGRCEPTINALPTLCLDRARCHAERLMRAGRAGRDEAGWLAGIPIAIEAREASLDALQEALVARDGRP